MDHFPLFLNMKHKSCVVIGGGDIAFRKVSALLRAGAKVKVVALKFCDELKSIENDNLLLITEAYQKSHLTDQVFVIAATDIRPVNEVIHADALELKIPVNVVDNPDLCTFIFPALIERGPMTIAISSGGNAPVLARLLRAKIESVIPFEYGTLAKLAQKYRDKVKAVFKNTNQRRNFWESIFEGNVAQSIFDGQVEKAEQLLNEKLESNDYVQKKHGEVYLVGAGPGDPELLTFKALRLMQQADIVIYDRLVSPEVLDLTRRDAHKVYVGKKSKYHCVPQQDINQLLLDYAKKGHRVLRLKGGDPFIFGRGGEEAQELVKENIPFQVVPGITSAAGASNYCGIPLTHRDYAHSVTFVTGHLKNDSSDLNWPSLAQAHQTVVIYMGLAALPVISKELIAHGLESKTKVAIIQNATRHDQKIVIGDLTNITQKVEDAGIVSPAITIIGDVINLYDELAPCNQVGLLQEAHGNLALARKTA